MKDRLIIAGCVIAIVGIFGFMLWSFDYGGLIVEVVKWLWRYMASWLVGFLMGLWWPRILSVMREEASHDMDRQ